MMAHAAAPKAHRHAISARISAGRRRTSRRADRTGDTRGLNHSGDLSGKRPLTMSGLVLFADALRYVLGRTLVEKIDQSSAGRRSWHLTALNDVTGTEVAAVEVLVGAAVGTQGGTFQRDSGKQTSRSRVAQDLGAHDDVGSGGGITSFRPRRSGGVGTELNFAGEHRIRAAIVHDEENKISGLTPQLESDVTRL